MKKICQINNGTTNPPPITSVVVNYSKYKEIIVGFASSSGAVLATTSVPTQLFKEYTSISAVYIANQLYAIAKYIDDRHLGAGAMAGEANYGYCIVWGVW